MANQQIFCNAPWYELNIYWDGSLGACCQEAAKIYSEEQTQFNIKTMTLSEWFNSGPLTDFRKRILGDEKINACKMCYAQEQASGTSKRIKGNQKSVIFTKTVFDKSFEQSPGRKHFDNSGLTKTQPIDLHIDLGNYCNLACKMCHPCASSTIAAQMVKWGDNSSKKFIGSDWTRDTEVWNRVLNEIANIEKLSNVHFMGGETLITEKFESFVDFMIAHNKTDIGISFVTNGTTFNKSLIEKLTRFSRLGIEVSIETLTAHNRYIRQGTDTGQVLKNIEIYLRYCNNANISVTARPAVSALSIGHHDSLLQYCLDKNFIIKSLIVLDPEFLKVNVLPWHVRQFYIKKYTKLIKDNKLDTEHIAGDYNESSVYRVRQIVYAQALQCINLLSDITDNTNLLKDLVAHCRKWDQVYGYNALELYPELAEVFVEHGY